MTKRSYPFGESFSSQYKIHVGQKELNHGVLGNIYRQEIYEKTKDLLFNGTKAVMGRLWKVDGEVKCSNGDSFSPIGMPVLEENQTLLRGQMQIGLDGKLRKTTSVPGTVVAPVCCVCQKASGMRRSCSQCDRLACSTCTQQCTSCSSRCCSVCTIIDYTDRYDRVLCCSCSP